MCILFFLLGGHPPSDGRPIPRLRHLDSGRRHTHSKPPLLHFPFPLSCISSAVYTRPEDVLCLLGGSSPSGGRPIPRLRHRDSGRRYELERHHCKGPARIQYRRAGCATEWGRGCLRLARRMAGSLNKTTLCACICMHTNIYVCVCVRIYILYRANRKHQHGNQIEALDALRGGGGAAAGWNDAWQVALI